MCYRNVPFKTARQKNVEKKKQKGYDARARALTLLFINMLLTQAAAVQRAAEQKAANARSLEMKERRRELDRLEDAKQLEYIRQQEAAARYVMLR